MGGRPFTSVGEFNAFAESMIVGVLDAIDVGRTSVVATSFGAYFALLGAAAHPERVDSIVELAWPFGAPIAKIPLSMRFGSVPGMAAITAKIPPTRFAVRAILKQLGLKRALQNGRFSDEMSHSFSGGPKTRWAVRRPLNHLWPVSRKRRSRSCPRRAMRHGSMNPNSAPG